MGCDFDCPRCRLIERGIDPSVPLGPREMMKLLAEPPAAHPDRLIYSDATFALGLRVETLRLQHEDVHRQVGAAQLAVSAASDDASRREAEASLVDVQAQLEELGEQLGVAMVASNEAIRREAALHHQSIYERGVRAQREAGQERSTSRLQRLKGRR